MNRGALWQDCARWPRRGGAGLWALKEDDGGAPEAGLLEDGVFPLIPETRLQEAAGPLWPCYGAALFLACRPGSRDVGLSLNGPHLSKPGPPAKNTPAG